MTKVNKREFKSKIKKAQTTKPGERNKRFPDEDEKRIHDWKQLLVSEDDDELLD